MGDVSLKPLEGELLPEDEAKRQERLETIEAFLGRVDDDLAKHMAELEKRVADLQPPPFPMAHAIIIGVLLVIAIVCKAAVLVLTLAGK